MRYRDQLIFDVGLHKGEDTAYYLARGYSVIAVEADPDLAALCRTKFSTHQEAGKLVIIEGAIVDSDVETVTFYKNRKNSKLGTTSAAWAKRNSKLRADSVAITVPTIKIRDLFQTYGVPYYLKIDIEGMDVVCLKQLLQLSERPRYISLESDKVSFDGLKNEFALFKQLGYRKFKVVQQAFAHKLTVPLDSNEGEYVDYRFERGSSGLFGEDIPGAWLDERSALARYRKIFRRYRLYGDTSQFRRSKLGSHFISALQRVTGYPFPGWYDTHAKLT